MILKNSVIITSRHLLKLLDKIDQSTLLAKVHFTRLALNTMASKGDNKKLFLDDDHAKSYARFRPIYPSTVFETIFNFCKEKSTVNKLAVDVGCGSGQSSLPLMKYFTRVFGVDISEQQISNAPADVPGLSFYVSPAEELSFVDKESVDLITIGQALHWIQLDKFYSQAERILKLGGSVAAYGYGVMSINHTEVNDYLLDIHDVKLANSWANDRKHIVNKYSCLPSPYDCWLRNDDLVMEKHLTVEQLIGYMSSWSAVQTYMKQNQDRDLMGEIREKLLAICSENDFKREKVFKVTWPIFILMAHKPGNLTLS